MADSKQTDSINVPPRRPSGYDWMKKVDPTNKLVTEYDKRLKEYGDFCLNNETESMELYREKLKRPVEKKEYGFIDVEYLYEVFLVCYRHVNDRTFDETANNGEGRSFARTMLLYFVRNKAFLKSPLISDKTEKSLDKGVMIVGKWGNGKTSVMKTIHYMFSRPLSEPIYVKNKEGNFHPLSVWNRNFTMFTANEVVDDYEWRDNTTKAEFWTMHTKGVKVYDDMLTERAVSNYGKFEMFKDVLEKRNAKGLRTVVTCNYTSDAHTLERFKGKELIDITMFEIGIRYGKRVYDRLFSDFNIIELNGKSMRK